MGGNGPRIWTPTVVTTTGGIDDHELFAKAILTRAMSLSEDPSRETIVVTAHGAGSDARNDSWKKTLDSLTDQMKTHGGDQFKAIHSGTWREDWPDKRDPEIAEIRGFVEAGSQNGGRVIVVPARTTLVGPEAELLEGLDFVLGSGFAPSAEFTEWVESQILAGAAQLGVHSSDSSSETDASAEPSAGHQDHHGH